MNTWQTFSHLPSPPLSQLRWLICQHNNLPTVTSRTGALVLVPDHHPFSVLSGTSNDAGGGDGDDDDDDKCQY